MAQLNFQNRDHDQNNKSPEMIENHQTELDQFGQTVR